MAFDTSGFIGNILILIILVYLIPIWIVTKITKKRFLEVFKTIFWFWLAQFIVITLLVAMLGFSKSDVQTVIGIGGGMLG